MHIRGNLLVREAAETTTHITINSNITPIKISGLRTCHLHVHLQKDISTWVVPTAYVIEHILYKPADIYDLLQVKVLNWRQTVIT